MPHDAALSQYFYANRMGRIVVQTMDSIMGREQLKEVLRVARLEKLLEPGSLPASLDKRFPFEWVSALQEATEQVYGETAGRSLNARVGRGIVGSGLKEFDAILGISDLPLRLMPLGMKFRVGLDVFARMFNQISDQVVRISEGDDAHLWIIERCAVCWGRHTDEPCCQLALGILDEAIFWGTGGRRYNAQEILCVAKGDPTCTIAIDKRPIE